MRGEPIAGPTKSFRSVVLDSKLGVRAHQFRNSNFVLSLDGPPAETGGRVLAGCLEWSGSFQCAFDHNTRNIHALCGINPFAAAYHLDPGEIFATPKMLWAWSTNGLGDMSRKLHRWARDHGMRNGHQARSVLLNNWEATFFDFDCHRIVGLYDPAKELGAELFLLDDGWFGNKYPRVNDEAGLGDWEPNRQRLPDGLAPLAAEAVKRGLQFGIWMEPEMVNPKSELFEQHPDWVIAQSKREFELQRHQMVLDLSRPEVQAFEWRTIQGILSVSNISYAKWDPNAVRRRSCQAPACKLNFLNCDHNLNENQIYSGLGLFTRLRSTDQRPNPGGGAGQQRGRVRGQSHRDNERRRLHLRAGGYRQPENMGRSHSVCR